MTFDPDLDSLMHDWMGGWQDRAVLAIRSRAGLEQKVRDEIARLETPGPRNLLEVDEVSRQLHSAFKAMLARVT